MDVTGILRRFRDCRVLVIGDLILDCYIWGRVSRISPEAPVPVVDVSHESFTLGGAANVASNVVSLGGRATVLGAVGKDRAAGKLESLINEQGVDLTVVEDSRPTTVKTRVIAHNQQVVRFDQENRDYLSGPALKGILAQIDKLIKSHDAVIISDYKKGVINREVMAAVLKAAGTRKFVSVDPKVGHFHLYKKASLMTPNLMEAAQGSGIEISDNGSLLKAGARLLSKFGIGSVLITRGEAGMSLFNGNEALHIPSLARKVYDVTGAGDTVIAAFTLALAAGGSLEEAAKISNHAAGIVVGEVGTARATSAAVRQSVKTSKLTVSRENF